jgi:hypothetical protein
MDKQDDDKMSSTKEEVNLKVKEFDDLLKILNSRGLFVEEYTYLSLIMETISESFKETIIESTILDSFNKR